MSAVARMADRRHPILAVSTGCPAGVGPEISVAAAARTGGLAASLLVGDPRTLRRAAEVVGVARRRLVLVSSTDEIDPRDERSVWIWAASSALARDPAPGRPSREDGRAQLAYVDEALRLVRAGMAAAIVTAPVSKEAIATSGARGAARFRGHTEHLERALGAREVVMAFHSDELVTSLVTTHLPLARVPRAITRDGVARAAFWLARLLSDLGEKRPRVLVSGLNPHAGEHGLLGKEELTEIAPGVERARARLAKARVRAVVDGPVGSETAFRLAKAKKCDGVVAMYHDQATIPMKLVSFGEAVNVTLGLPIVRTSVDHGTAYDIAWKGVADVSSFVQAVTLAAKLSRRAS
jgi:4-hydroxythreonine-4-phosphate dehydrogenase